MTEQATEPRQTYEPATEPRQTYEPATEPRHIYEPATDTPTSYAREAEGAQPPLDHPPYKGTALRHPKQPLVYLPPRAGPDPVRGGALIFATTPSQTAGPHFAIGPPWRAGPQVVPAGTPGAITITGTVFDGHGRPLPDHLLEPWQADPDGRFADMHGYGGPSELPEFRGFARCGAERVRMSGRVGRRR